MNYREMTEAQMLEWGTSERATRMAELDCCRSAEALKAAQEGCERRRKIIGATRGQAADMVILAGREIRRQELIAARALPQGAPNV